MDFNFFNEELKQFIIYFVRDIMKLLFKIILKHMNIKRKTQQNIDFQGRSASLTKKGLVPFSLLNYFKLLEKNIFYFIFKITR